MSRGKRSSQWAVFLRCLALIRRVLREPATREELIAAVQDQVGLDAYGQAEGGAVAKRLENDLGHVRHDLGVALYYDNAIRKYRLTEGPLPAFDLPDKDLTTIGWLEDLFEPGTPNHDSVSRFLERLRTYLPFERVERIKAGSGEPTISFSRRDADEIPKHLLRRLQQALDGRRRIIFSYRSPRHADGLPRQHTVDPEELYFDPRLHHWYLRGLCRSSEGPDGRKRRRGRVNYRLGRISNLRVLPDKVPPVDPHVPSYDVVYRLRRAIVGPEPASPQPGIEIEEQVREEDGSLTVRGQTDDLFRATQALLHYGAGCEVLGGPEMRGRMEEIVREMGEVYGSPTSVGEGM